MMAIRSEGAPDQLLRLDLLQRNETLGFFFLESELRMRAGYFYGTDAASAPTEPEKHQMTCPISVQHYLSHKVLPYQFDLSENVSLHVGKREIKAFAPHLSGIPGCRREACIIAFFAVCFTHVHH